MSCIRELSITITEEPEEAVDMPLNAAVYDASRDVIFAVRGGYVFKLNATTGALIATARYTFPTWDTASIVYAPNVDQIYCSWWNEPTADGIAPNAGLYRLVPDTLAFGNFSLIGTAITGDLSSFLGSGPMGLVYVGGFIFGVARNNSGRSITLMKYDPTTDLFDSAVNFDGPTTVLESQVVVKDSDGSLSVIARNRVRNYSSALAFNFFTANFSALLETGYGLAHDLVNDQYYVACNDQIVLKIPATAGGAAFPIATGRADATPRRAAWNSVNGKVYIPGGKDNSVIIIDPSDGDSVETKLGFDSPIDFVFTPTKVWAVQHGAEGLKEVV